MLSCIDITKHMCVQSYGDNDMMSFKDSELLYIH
jgi:hypothetical protein